MSEATMTAPGPGTNPTADQPPVSHTDARHVALATVEAGRVAYDRELAQWTLRPRRDGDPMRVVRGAEQRTLRDLRQFGLITYTDADRPQPVRLTAKGDGALALWGRRRDRLRGVAPTR